MLDLKTETTQEKLVKAIYSVIQFSDRFTNIYYKQKRQKVRYRINKNISIKNKNTSQ